MTYDVEPQQDRGDELAETLGVPVLEFAELFGADWIENEGPVSHDYDSDPSGGEGWDVTPWMISGAPPQLMIRVFAHGVFLAVPAAAWRDIGHGLEYRAGRPQYLSVADLSTDGPSLVAKLLRRRRSSFRYCCFCRRSTPPETRFADDVCMACATGWYGVVY